MYLRDCIILVCVYSDVTKVRCRDVETASFVKGENVTETVSPYQYGRGGAASTNNIKCFLW